MKTRRIHGQFTIATATLLALLSGSAAAQDCTCVGNFDEPFAAPSLDPRWSAATSTCGTASTASGQLQMSKSSSCVGWVEVVMDRAHYTVCGDFDISVSYDISSFPAASTGSGRYHSIFVINAATGALMAGVERYRETANSCVPFTDSYKAYTTVPGCSPTAVYAATADVAGKFRLQRVSTTVFASYWNGASWVQIMSRPIALDPVAIVLSSGTNGTLATSHVGIFDDLSVRSELACPVPALPSSWGNMKSLYR